MGGGQFQGSEGKERLKRGKRQKASLANCARPVGIKRDGSKAILEKNQLVTRQRHGEGWRKWPVAGTGRSRSSVAPKGGKVI